MQGTLELILFLVTAFLAWRTRKTHLLVTGKLVLFVMALLSLTFQCILFGAVLPGYTQEKIPIPIVLGLSIFYGLEVYLIARLSLVYAPVLKGGGFALLNRSNTRSLSWLWAGFGGGVIAAGLIMIFSAAFDQRFFPDRPSLIMGLGIGLANLVREEVLFRLGFQTLLAVWLRKYHFGNVGALIGSAVLFELWHNPLAQINGLNFLISLTFATLYHYWGYEASAVAHGLSDVAAFWLIPLAWSYGNPHIFFH